MSFIYIFFIAIGLTFDTFAVSISTGLIVSKIHFWQAFRVAFVLAIVQALMPIAGWFAGIQVKDIISDYDHWVAVSLLSILGVKMIFEAYKTEDEEKPRNPLKPVVLLGMAVATSIDALIVGISFGFLSVNITYAASIIGIVTFLVAMIGMLIGKKAGNFFGKKMEIIGGIILILIGLKILFEHTMI